MKTIQMTLDEKLLYEVDKTVSKLNTTRSAFTRKALKEAIKKIHTRQLEIQHLKGYKKQPGKNGEFNIWENEQEWGDK